jgi:hypothetical protein
MPDPAERLRTVSDVILEDVEQLEAVERDLQGAEVGDPRIEVASETAHAGAELLQGDATEATRLAREVGEGKPGK